MDLRIGTVNAGGWLRKTGLIQHLVDADNIHILGITETHIVPHLNPTIPGYRIFRKDCTRKSAGVALAIDSRLPAAEFDIPNDFLHLHVCGASLQCPAGVTHIFCIYIQPNSPFPTDFMDWVATLPRAIVMGDFNARHTSFGDTTTNPLGRSLADELLLTDLFRIPNRNPTFINHQGSSIIDHIIISSSLTPLFSDEAELASSITSFHLPIVVSTSILNPPARRTGVRNFRDWKNARWDDFQTRMEELIREPPEPRTTADIDDAVNLLSTAITTAIDECVPMKTIDIRRPPLPPFIVHLIHEKRRLYRQFVRTHDPNIKTQWNRLNAIVRRQTLRYREERWNTFCSGLDYREGARFWKRLKAVAGEKSSTSGAPLRDQGGTVISDPQGKANLFAETLANVHQVPQNPLFDDGYFERTTRSVRRHPDLIVPQNIPRPEDLPEHDLLAPILAAETEEAIARGKNSAPGEDNITRQVLRHLPRSSVDFLILIYNSCLRSGHFPLSWKRAEVVMIPKPNKDRSDPKSYRPISLLNVLGKTYERILSSRLQNHLDELEIVPSFQYGFQSGKRTHDPLCRLHTDCSVALNRGHCTVAVMLDIERAFDAVWHVGLLQKLLRLPCPAQFVRIISSYLSQREHRVRVNGSKSDPFTPEAGVPQGSILAPLLFVIYCHDIPRPNHPNLRLAQYADDTALWASARTSEQASRILAPYLSSLERWFQRWRIKPNPQKTQTIMFRHPNSTQRRQFDPRDVQLALWGDRLRLSPSVTYLGVAFTYTLHWGEETRRVLDKVQRRSGILSRLRGTLRGCHPRTLIHTYKTYIRPLIEYRFSCFSTAGQHLIAQLKSKERAIARRALRLMRDHPSGEVCELAGIPPIDTRLALLRSRYVKSAVEQQSLDALRFLRTQPQPTRRPRRKLKHPPAIFLQDFQNLDESLPDDLEDILDNIPIVYR